MKETKKPSLMSFVFNLSKFYSDLKQANKEAGEYKLVEIKKGELGEEPEVLVQVRNTSHSFLLKAFDAVKNNELLNKFSREDVRMLTYLACDYKYRPKVKIEKLNFCSKINRLVFSVISGSKDSKKNKLASELVNNKEAISNMSPEDAKKVGYTAASELSQMQREQMRSLK
jgi:hypothetical protein